MKTLLSAVLLFCLVQMGLSQGKVNGAWSRQTDGNTEVLLFQDGYFTSTTYNKDKFLKTWGGPYRLEKNLIHIKVEFNSTDKADVGSARAIAFSQNDDQLTFNNNNYKRIDNGEAPLAGVWKITDRMQDGNLAAIHRTGPRKTLKMLTGNRFQWFAINPETGEFSGTGGGTYSFKDGRYTENIEFFSRDQSRVGASLSFDGKLENGKWHHSGLSSRGDKIYEVWGRGQD